MFRQLPLMPQRSSRRRGGGRTGAIWVRHQTQMGSTQMGSTPPPAVSQGQSYNAVSSSMQPGAGTMRFTGMLHTLVVLVRCPVRLQQQHSHSSRVLLVPLLHGNKGQWQPIQQQQTQAGSAASLLSAGWKRPLLQQQQQRTWLHQHLAAGLTASCRACGLQAASSRPASACGLQLAAGLRASCVPGHHLSCCVAAAAGAAILQVCPACFSSMQGTWLLHQLLPDASCTWVWLAE